MIILNIAVFLSSGAFIFYGVNCLISQKMKDEFIRFGLGKQRILIGYLQLLGGIGLLLGFFFIPDLAFIASGGLSLLMFSGFVVRIKIKDSILESIPSLLLALINLYICISYFSKLTLM